MAVNGHSADLRRGLADATPADDIPRPIRCAAEEASAAACVPSPRPGWRRHQRRRRTATLAPSHACLLPPQPLLALRAATRPHAQNHSDLSAGFIAAVKRDGGVPSGAPHSGSCGGDCALRRRAPPREVRSRASMRPPRANDFARCAAVSSTCRGRARLAPRRASVATGRCAQAARSAARSGSATAPASPPHRTRASLAPRS